MESPLGEEDAHEIAELLGDADGSVVLKEMKKYKARVAAFKAEASAYSASQSKGVRKKKIGAKDHLAVENARSYLPVGITGCTLSMQTEWHTRWRVTYPRLVAPFEASASFHDPASQRSTLQEMLRWVWEAHTAKEKVACPWDLDAI